MAAQNRFELDVPLQFRGLNATIDGELGHKWLDSGSKQRDITLETICVYYFHRKD